LKCCRQFHFLNIFISNAQDFSIKGNKEDEHTEEECPFFMDI
jgi:hypothetical protein